VLGETSRLDMQASLPIERNRGKRRDRGYWQPERPAPVPDTFPSVDLDTDVTTLVDVLHRKARHADVFDAPSAAVAPADTIPALPWWDAPSDPQGDDAA
jgi:hypothetical protein